MKGGKYVKDITFQMISFLSQYPFDSYIDSCYFNDNKESLSIFNYWKGSIMISKSKILDC